MRRLAPAVGALCAAALLAPSASALEFGDAKEVTKEELVAGIHRDLGKVDRSIAVTKELIDRARTRPYLPDLQFRMAELYVEKSRLVFFLALEKAGQIRILLANLGPDFQPVRLVCPGLGAYVRVKRLDRTNAERAMRAPEAFRDEKGLLQETSGDKLELSLSPYAVVRIDPAEANGG